MSEPTWLHQPGEGEAIANIKEAIRGYVAASERGAME